MRRNEALALVPREIVDFAALPPDRRQLLMHMDELMSAIPFGTVVVVLQDGKVIQIETSEKIRVRQRQTLARHDPT